MTRTILDSFIELSDFLGPGIANGTGLDANIFQGLNTFPQIANDQPAMNAIANERRAMAAITNSTTAMNSVVGSQTGLDEVFSSQIAIEEVAASQIAMQVVAGSQAAMQEVASSQAAMTEVINSTAAKQEIRNVPLADSEFHLSGLYATTLDTFAGINTGVTGGFDDVALSQTAMQEVAASQTAMQEVAPSQAAMQEVAASQTAMQEVAPSLTAMQEVANSQVAMEEVTAQPLAMEQVGLSATAQSEILNSTIGKGVLDSNLVEVEIQHTNSSSPVADLAKAHKVYCGSIFVQRAGGSACGVSLSGDGFPNQGGSSDINLTVENFVDNVSAACCSGYTPTDGQIVRYTLIPTP